MGSPVPPTGEEKEEEPDASENGIEESLMKRKSEEFAEDEEDKR